MHKMSCYFLMGTASAKMVCIVVAYLQADLKTLVSNCIGSVKNMTVLQLNVFLTVMHCLLVVQCSLTSSCTTMANVIAVLMSKHLYIFCF
jgi:hypothetical protein